MINMTDTQKRVYILLRLNNASIVLAKQHQNQPKFRAGIKAGLHIEMLFHDVTHHIPISEADHKLINSVPSILKKNHITVNEVKRAKADGLFNPDNLL